MNSLMEFWCGQSAGGSDLFAGVYIERQLMKVIITIAINLCWGNL